MCVKDENHFMCFKFVLLFLLPNMGAEGGRTII